MLVRRDVIKKELATHECGCDLRYVTDQPRNRNIITYIFTTCYILIEYLSADHGETQWHRSLKREKWV